MPMIESALQGNGPNPPPSGVLQRVRANALVIAASVVLLPLFFAGCVRLCQTLLSNQAMASAVFDDSYEPSFVLSDPGIERAAAGLRDQAMRDPMSLAGFDRRQILILLAKPDLRRSEGPYRHWQYIADRCVMDIYLKIDRAEDEPAKPVQYVDFRPRHKAYYGMGRAHALSDTVDRQACMSDLIARRLNQQSAAAGN
jgi:hypothetical protein